MRHITPILFLLSLSVACSNDKPVPAPEPVAVSAPVAEVCTVDKAKQQLAAKYPGFEVKAAGDAIMLAKTLKGADGQKLGLETHQFVVKDDKGVCNLTECESAREVGGQKLLNQFCAKKSQYYEGGQLVYEDTSLDNGLWFRKYSSLAKIPTQVPNWASPDGLDLYMTFVLRSEQKASRVPVWGVQAVWQKEGDDFTLIAGEVILKNPEKGVTQEEVYTVLRTNAQGEVTARGVLYPVSGTTFKAYLANLQAKKPDGWERDHQGDEQAMLAYFEGPMKHSRAAALPLDRVFQIRGTRSSQLPVVAPDFLPGFDKNPRLH